MTFLHHLLVGSGEFDGADRFVRQFRPVLDESAGHIYESALPLPPHGTDLYQKVSKFQGKTLLIYGGYCGWEPHRVVEVRSAPVTSVSWSPDGTRIVVSDGYICDTEGGSYS